VINQVIRLRRLRQHADQIIESFCKGQSICTRVASGKTIHGAPIGVKPNHLDFKGLRRKGNGGADATGAHNAHTFARDAGLKGGRPLSM
jgi:hypothetical protein